MLRVHLAPHALVHSGLGVAGAVAQDAEAKIVLGSLGGCESRGQRNGQQVAAPPVYAPHARDCSRSL